MELVQIYFEIVKYHKLSELKKQHQELVRHAQEKVKSAYAPYSDFKVGASVWGVANGFIITGTNQENSAYPSGLCAERVGFILRQNSQVSLGMAVKSF